jgi:pimeloyl-ACP methyl ester carboxylesterase
MSKTLSFSGLNVSYTDSGNGDAIVLIHGYLESKEIWDPLTEMLRKRFRVIAIDLPGHGKSGVLSEIHSMEFLAGAVKAVIDSLGITRIMLTGHSLGGYVTLAFLELYPQCLAGYCLFHSHPNPDSEATIKNRNREKRVVKAGKKSLMYPDNVTRMFSKKNLPKMKEALERSKMIASGSPADGIVALLNGMIARPSRRSLVEKGERPLLWILGRDDQYFSPSAATDGVMLPENAKVIILENSGHLGFVEETALSCQVISDFADTIFMR